MTSLKDEYESLKTKHANVKENIATLLGKKEVADKELKKIDEELKALIKDKNPQEVLEKLEKEIEVRLEMLRSDILKMEREVEEFLEDKDLQTEPQSVSDFKLDLEEFDGD